MMRKAAQIRLFKIAILFLIVLGFLSAAHFLVSMQIGGLEDDLQKMNAQVLQVKSKLAEIQTEQKIRDEARTFFRAYEVSDSSEPEQFTRQRARANIAAMRKQFGLNSIQLNHSGFKEVKHPLATENSVALFSYASIRFTASYDVPIYDFIAAIDDSLPGVISVSTINIRRLGEPNEADLKRISEGEEVNLVGGEIGFQWFGVVDPTLAPAQEIMDSGPIDHSDNIKNIFAAMDEVGQGLDKTMLSKTQPGQTAPAKSSTQKLKPLAGVQPIKQLGAIKKPVVEKAQPRPGMARPGGAPGRPADGAKPAAANAANAKTGVKLQNMRPTNTMESAPNSVQKSGMQIQVKGGANGN